MNMRYGTSETEVRPTAYQRWSLAGTLWLVVWGITARLAEEKSVTAQIPPRFIYPVSMRLTGGWCGMGAAGQAVVFRRASAGLHFGRREPTGYETIRCPHFAISVLITVVDQDPSR